MWTPPGEESPIDVLSIAPHDITLPFEGEDVVLRQICGEYAQNLQVVGKALGVRVQQRGDSLRVTGQDGSVLLARAVLLQLGELARRGFPLHPADVDQGCRLVMREPAARFVELFTETIFVPGRHKTLFPRTPRQRDYIQAIRTHDIVLGVGPAGTGKTYIAMAMAVAALTRNEVARIVLCRPAVEAGEKLGFLPGDLAEKVNPYLRPLYDALNDLADFERANKLIQRGVIEVAPLAFMRGRTLNDAFVILDEAQNTTSEQMKMFLTRIGNGTHAVVTGDITQIDLPRGQLSGMVEALEILADVSGIRAVRFTHEDVVRHPLVSAIIQAYDRAKARDPHGSSLPRSYRETPGVLDTDPSSDPHPTRSSREADPHVAT
jgi:phosphate starvation-inducible PhoH-like protein